MIRAAVALLCLLSLPASARAQSSPAPASGRKAAKNPLLLPPPLLKPDDSLAPARVDPAMLDRAYRRARTARNVGMSLACPGLALSLIGGVVLIYTANDHQPIYTQPSLLIGGTVSLFAGLAIAVPGIYFWITGQDDMDSVVWRRRQLTLSSP